MDIGNRRIIFSDTLLIPDGEPAKFIILDPPNARIGPVVVTVTPEKSDREWPIYWGPEKEGTDTIFGIHFTEVEGTDAATAGFISIGSVPQGKLSFAATYHRIGTLSAVKIMFGIST